jgi:hypothetical protein
VAPPSQELEPPAIPGRFSSSFHRSSCQNCERKVSDDNYNEWLLKTRSRAVRTGGAPAHQDKLNQLKRINEILAGKWPVALPRGWSSYTIHEAWNVHLVSNNTLCLTAHDAHKTSLNLLIYWLVVPTHHGRNGKQFPVRRWHMCSGVHDVGFGAASQGGPVRTGPKNCMITNLGPSTNSLTTFRHHCRHCARQVLFRRAVTLLCHSHENGVHNIELHYARRSIFTRQG